ncbi:MAG: NADH-quinone oxidoreductase subunit J [Burkholderiales bacterium]
MSFVTLVFYAFSAILLAAAVGVVTARNTVHAVLLLVLAFVTAAGIWLLLEAEFLAITLVLVYVGAVTVLFLFVVMTIDINIEKLRAGFWNYLPLSLGVGVLMAVEMVLALKSRGFDAIASSHPAGYSNTKELGRLLYTDYVYPFEIAAVILLVAMIAAIAITMRKRKTTKYQNPAQQVSVRREDRVRLISMPSERRGAAEGEE